MIHTSNLIVNCRNPSGSINKTLSSFGDRFNNKVNMQQNITKTGNVELSNASAT